MTNYSPDAKPSKSARTIRLRNAHQAMCSFHDMLAHPRFKNARSVADSAILAIERATYAAGIALEDVTNNAHPDGPGKARDDANRARRDKARRRRLVPMGRFDRE